jgi:ribosomal protein S27E
MQKKFTSSPLALGIGSRDAMQLFSTFLSLPCCQCMNQGSNVKICNLELLKYTKIITRCCTCPNEQVRYSTAS